LGPLLSARIHTGPRKWTTKKRLARVGFARSLPWRSAAHPLPRRGATH